MVNSSAFSARLWQRSAWAFNEFVSTEIPLNHAFNFALPIRLIHGLRTDSKETATILMLVAVDSLSPEGLDWQNQTAVMLET